MPADHGKLPEFLREALEDEPQLDRKLALQLPEFLDLETARPAGLERLMRAVAEPPLRYAPFFDQLAELWDVAEGEVVRVLERSRDPRAWRGGLFPGVRFIGVRGGPKIAGARAFLARFGAGFHFPKHRHSGPEAVLVLSGGYTDSSGNVAGPGDLQEMAPGSEHALVVHPGEACVVGVRQMGMELTGPVMRLLAKLFGR